MQKILTVSKMRDSENLIFSCGISEFDLMEIAVDGIYPHVKKGVKTLVVVGGGNNGGDGLGISLKLLKDNQDVSVLLLSDSIKLSGAIYLNQLKNLNAKIYKYNKGFDFSAYSQIVDCIFGIGFHGDVSGLYKEVIEKINETDAYIISVDIPSGLNGDSGLTSLAVESDLTVAVGALKTGNVLNQAKDYQKKVVSCKIGKTVDTNVFLFEDADCLPYLKSRKNFSHKGNYGYVAVFGGCENYVGAPKLATLGLCALKSGAGVSKIIAPNCIKDAILSNITLSTYYGVPSVDGGVKFDKEAIDNALNKVSSLSFGMGIGQSDEVCKTLEYILETFTGKLILDADGLNALSKLDKNLLKSAKCKIVITPHIMEMSRISGLTVKEITENPISASVNFANEYNVTVLLKGTATVISDGKTVYIVNSGAPGMATAGSGDVLSGVLTGVLGWNDLDVGTVAFSAYITGLAGQMAQEKFGDISMTALDTVQFLPVAIKKLANN